MVLFPRVVCCRVFPLLCGSTKVRGGAECSRVGSLSRAELGDDARPSRVDGACTEAWSPHRCMRRMTRWCIFWDLGLWAINQQALCSQFGQQANEIFAVTRLRRRLNDTARRSWPNVSAVSMHLTPCTGGHVAGAVAPDPQAHTPEEVGERACQGQMCDHSEGF